MNVAELEASYRSRFTDNVAQLHALSSTDYLAYLNEAQDEACIRADLIFDKSSSFCTIAVTSTASVYSIDSSIYAINYARLIDTDNISSNLRLMTFTELDLVDPAWRESVDRPWAIQHYNNSIELADYPDSDYTLKLEVYRLAKRLTGDTSIPEISSTLHSPLNYWVLYRMYNSPDEDVSNPRKGMENLIEFEKIFGTRPMAEHHKDKYSSRPHHNRCIPI